VNLAHGSRILLQHAVFYACVLLPGLHIYAHLDTRDHWEYMRPCGAVHAMGCIRGEGFPYLDTISWVALGFHLESKQ
jgi:hypothetical protein